MNVSIRVGDNALTVFARADGDGFVGDASFDVSPGETMLGYTYEELKALGDGEHELEDRGEA